MTAGYILQNSQVEYINLPDMTECRMFFVYGAKSLKTIYCPNLSSNMNYLAYVGSGSSLQDIFINNMQCKDILAIPNFPGMVPAQNSNYKNIVFHGADGINYDMGIDMSNPLSPRTLEFVVSYEANELYVDNVYYFLRCDQIGFRINFNRDVALAVTLRAAGGYVSTPFAQPQFKGSVSLVGTDIPYRLNPTERATAHYYANGSKIDRDNAAFGGNPSSSMLLDLFSSGRGWPSSNVMKIYAIRIYNRALTQNEVEHNYKIDKERFGL